VEDFLTYLKPYRQSILSSRICEAVSSGCLSKSLSQGAMIDFYPLVESFPQYLAINLAKVPQGNSDWNNRTRDWLINNIHQERLHAEWWREMAGRFGVSSQSLCSKIYPPPEIDAISNYLWRI